MHVSYHLLHDINTFFIQVQTIIFQGYLSWKQQDWKIMVKLDYGLLLILSIDDKIFREVRFLSIADANQ